MISELADEKTFRRASDSENQKILLRDFEEAESSPKIGDRDFLCGLSYRKTSYLLRN